MFVAGDCVRGQVLEEEAECSDGGIQEMAALLQEPVDGLQGWPRSGYGRFIYHLSALVVHESDWTMLKKFTF